MRAKIKLLFCSVLIAGSLAVAQDELPRDNGIFKYHQPPRWRETESHPLRVLAYLVHPVGWTLREGIFRPWSSFAGSTEFTRSFFGFREPFDFRESQCFSSSDAIPDCRAIDPMVGLSKAAAPDDVISDLAAAVSDAQRQVFIPDVNFEFDRAELNSVGKGRVRQIAQLLASVPSLKVVVEGHTDYVGTDEYNLRLGERRAQAVIDELKELGVDASRLSPISYGETKPVFTEEEDWARAVNRRVQFSVEGSATAAVEQEAPATITR